jgi:hypothetical protein
VPRVSRFETRGFSVCFYSYMPKNLKRDYGLAARNVFRVPCPRCIGTGSSGFDARGPRGRLPKELKGELMKSSAMRPEVAPLEIRQVDSWHFSTRLRGR